MFQLCALAQSWANHLAHINTFYYRNDKDVGQNLFCRATNSIQTDVTGNTSWRCLQRAQTAIPETSVEARYVDTEYRLWVFGNPS